MIATLLLVAAPYQAIAVPPAPQDGPSIEQQGDIVVRAKALKDTAASLSACIARHCPPDQDVDATIEHAQGQVLAGDYLAARRTLLASINRNKGEAKRYPKPVSDLYLVQSRISLHLGEPTSTRNEAIEALRSLRAGLDSNDLVIFSQRIELADTRARLGDWEQAIEFYRDIERDARGAGEVTAATLAKFKRAVLYGTLAERDTVFASSARRELRELGDLTDPKLKGFADAAAVLAARFRIKGDKGPALEDLVERATGSGAVEPVMLQAPAIKLNEVEPSSGTVTALLATDADYADQWINVGFRVQPDGRVADVQLLQRGAKLNDWWVRYVTDSVGGRRYAPLSKAQVPNATRVERYTMTSFWGFKTGTRIRARTPRPYVQLLDITPQPAKVAVR